MSFYVDDDDDDDLDSVNGNDVDNSGDNGGSGLGDQMKDKAGDAGKKALEKSGQKAATQASTTTAASTTAAGGATAASGAAAGGAAAGGAAAGGAAAGGAAAAGSASLMASLSYVLFWVALVILIIFVIIGLIMFFVTMPGMVMDKLKALFTQLGNYVAAYFGADTTEQISDVQIFETLDYLETMGWEIKTEGFLSEFIDENTDLSEVEDKLPENYTLDERKGVIRNADDDTIAYAKSDFIFSYIMSDNYVYTLKNENLVTQEDDVGFWGRVGAGIKAAWTKLRIFFADPFLDVKGTVDDWGKGLIVLYYDTGRIGEKGEMVSDPDGTTLFDWNKIKIDVDGKKLSIKRRSFLNNNNAMEFSLDGWTGRYGMPLEFLLSVHKVTQMPDLAMDMVTSFPTEISLLLHKISGAATAAYKNENGDYITYPDMKSVKGEGWSPTDGWTLSKEEAYNILKLGIKSPIGCTYDAPTFELLDSTDNGDGWIFDENKKNQLASYGFTDGEFTIIEEQMKQVVSVGTGESFKVQEAMLEKSDTNPTKESSAQNYGFSYSTASKTTTKSTLNGTQKVVNCGCECKNFTLHPTVTHKSTQEDGYIKCSHCSVVIYNQYAPPTYFDYYCKGTDYYQIEKVITTYNWVAPNSSDPEGEDATYQWTIYQYNVYTYSDEARTKGKKYVTTFLFEYILREFTTQELIDAGVLNPDGTSKSESTCSQAAQNGAHGVTECCETCRKYVKKIMSVLKRGDDQNFQAFAPYIADVTNHWYRDVYFVLDQSKPEVAGGFVDYDYDYETMVNERWTLYETYTDNEADGYKYNPAREGEFILFEMTEDGEYKKENNQYVLFDGEVEDARPSMLFKKVVKDGTTAYEPYEGTRIGLTEANGIYRRNTDGDYVPYTGDVAISKKAVSLSSKDTEALKDLGWINNYDDVWTAYDKKPTSSGYEALFTEDEIGKETDIETQQIMANSFINLNMTGNIVQTGEGQRTQTNSEIKKMFLTNEYFRYDGTDEVAEMVTKLRDKIYTEKRKDKGIGKYGPLTEEELDVYITKPNPAKEGETEKVYARDLASNVSLSQDSLTAFSALENTHTLDADYIYRDFKELIVELGYFTKEEVTGSSEIRRVMQFPIPDTGSGGYPNRAIDKYENEPGTTIHSKGDIDANEKNTIRFVINEFLKAEGEGAEELPEGQKNNDTGALIDEDVFRNQYADVPNINTVLGVGILAEDALQRVENANEGDYSSSTNGITVEDYLAKAREICEYMDEVGYDYCVGGDGSKCNHDNNYGDHAACLSGTFESSKESKARHNICCATLVSWALKMVEVDMSGCNNINYCPVLVPYMVYQLGGEVITEYSELEPGDVMCYIHDQGEEDFAHVDILGEEDGDGYLKYNGGHYAGPGKSSIGKFNQGSWDGEALCFGVRLFGNKKSEPSNYEGYLGNEAVVSPVTGVLLEYGTYSKEIDSERTNGEPNRINVDILYERDKDSKLSEALNVNDETKGQDNTGNKKDTSEPEGKEVVDRVGYAKILVLDAENYQKLESKTSNKWQSDSLVRILENKTTEKTDSGATKVSEKESIIFLDEEGSGSEGFDSNVYKDWSQLNKTVYAYKEFAEEYTALGIAGNVIYIDGFIPEKPDEDLPSGKKAAEEEGIDMENELPEGTKIEFSHYKVAPSALETQDETDEKTPISMYESEEVYKLASKKATNKAESIEDLKTIASTAVYLDDDDIVFIKEGTVLGRTMTDKELFEKVRETKYESYEYFRPTEEIKQTDEEKPANYDRVMGNYIRLIFRDEDGTLIENVEDYMKLDEMEPDVIGDIEQFMYWQAKEPEGFEYIIDGQQSYSYSKSNGQSRRNNSSDPYGHDYAIDDGGAGDRNLCPGMWMDPGSSASKIFTEVTGQTSIEMLSTWCTGTQLLDIYRKELEVQAETLRSSYPNLSSLKDDDTRLFGLMDVMYAGAGNFKIGTIDDAINAGRELTLDDFLSNCTSENAFYNQNQDGFTRRRICDWYMYSEGKFGVGVYDKSLGKEVKKRYEFTSETPFQDLMRDKEGAKIVDM